MVTRSAASTVHKVATVSPVKTAIDKGKSLLENSSSSSDESEDDEDSSTTPDNVLVGTGHAPSRKPRQFTTVAAAAHYELMYC
ncbi:hypothetical protein L6452_26068 [Arctium lappa]|uniref:Uncharacterized protein n=1 Tax=Arctium lappa TaxID=4217 RepID=A0ACB9ABW7_ARCLA|nr:hypothetical protein L6452_26068 [Arctium lappa]